jgi:hypothetical protein
MPVSVRLDAKTEGLVNRLAKQRGQTKSAVIREAIKFFTSSGNGGKNPVRPYEAIVHLLGCAQGGPPDLSEQTGQKFRKLLLERQRS